jgi:hypothetical protein
MTQVYLLVEAILGRVFVDVVVGAELELEVTHVVGGLDLASKVVSPKESRGLYHKTYYGRNLWFP